MSELCSGVRTLVARMDSNPEEFFGDAPKWRFMFAPNFREVLTEPEKGALHEALKNVRRKEFDTLVVKELLKEEMEGTLTMKAQGRYTSPQIGNGGVANTSNRALLSVSKESSDTSTGWFDTSTGWFK